MHVPGSEGAEYHVLQWALLTADHAGHSGPVSLHDSPFVSALLWGHADQCSRQERPRVCSCHGTRVSSALNKRAGSFSPVSSIHLPASDPKTGSSGTTSCRLHTPRRAGLCTLRPVC